MTEDNSQQQKQQYLRENILDKGYDANEFMEYFKEYSGQQEINLNDYTMDALIEVVNGFYSKKGQGNQSQNSFSQMPNDLNGEYGQNNINENSNNLNSNGQLNENGLENIVNCTKIEKNKFKDIDNLEIKIAFPEKVEAGIFSKSYVSYGVSVNPTGVNIRKRYSDFEWLHQVLNDHFLNCIIPPLCKKNYMEQFNEDFISKRARALEKFINGIAIHPILRNSFIFYDFLTIKDNEEFKQKKVMYEQPFKPKRINDFINLEGEIKVSLTNENEIYFQNIVDDAEMNKDLMSEIIKSYKGLFDLFNKINEKMAEIGYLWKKIEGRSSKFYESKNTTTSYQIMKELMKNWTEMHKKQVIQMRQNIVESFRYFKNEYSNFKPFAERINEKKDLFLKKFDEFYSKKNENQKKKLTIAEKIEKFNDIDFTQLSKIDTQDLREAKNFYCGYLSSFISEYERLRELNGKRIKDCVINLIDLFNKDYQEFAEIIKGKEAYYENPQYDENVGNDINQDRNEANL